MRGLPLCLFVVGALAGCASEAAPLACPESDSGDAGDLSATYAQRCNVPGSMGTQNWYRLVATLPGSDDVVQLELWPNRGVYAGKAVEPGTFQISGDETDYLTCGICLRAMADKGGELQRELFAVSGTVVVETVSSVAEAPFSATITNASFVELDGDKSPVEGGCTMDVERVKASGAIEIKGGGGGGGGGGGSAGSGGCLTTVGDN